MNDTFFHPFIISVLLIGLGLFGYSWKKIVQEQQKNFQYKAQKCFAKICEPFITRWTMPDFLSQYCSIHIYDDSCIVRYHQAGKDAKVLIHGIYQNEEIYDVCTATRYSYGQFQSYISRIVRDEYVKDYEKSIGSFREYT